MWSVEGEGRKEMKGNINPAPHLPIHPHTFWINPPCDRPISPWSAVLMMRVLSSRFVSWSLSSVRTTYASTCDIKLA